MLRASLEHGPARATQPRKATEGRPAHTHPHSSVQTTAGGAGPAWLQRHRVASVRQCSQAHTTEGGFSGLNTEPPPGPSHGALEFWIQEGPHQAGSPSPAPHPTPSWAEAAPQSQDNIVQRTVFTKGTKWKVQGWGCSPP